MVDGTVPRKFDDEMMPVSHLPKCYGQDNVKGNKVWLHLGSGLTFSPLHESAHHPNPTKPPWSGASTSSFRASRPHLPGWCRCFRAFWGASGVSGRSGRHVRCSSDIWERSVRIHCGKTFRRCHWAAKGLHTGSMV